GAVEGLEDRAVTLATQRLRAGGADQQIDLCWRQQAPFGGLHAADLDVVERVYEQMALLERPVKEAPHQQNEVLDGVLAEELAAHAWLPLEPLFPGLRMLTGDVDRTQRLELSAVVAKHGDDAF